MTRSPVKPAALVWMFTALAWFSAAAHAAPGETPSENSASVVALASAATPRSALSVQLATLASAGLVVSYDRLIPRRSFSLSGLVGGRVSGAGDYSSRALSAGLGLRYWFTGRAVRSSIPGQTLLGPYLGATVAIMHTSVRMGATDDMPARAIGGSVTMTESLDVGYRFALWRRVELTPSLSVAVRTDIDTQGGLPSSTRGTITMGVTMGWLH